MLTRMQSDSCYCGLLDVRYSLGCFCFMSIILVKELSELYMTPLRRQFQRCLPILSPGYRVGAALDE